jgi:hypothetical protein
VGSYRMVSYVTWWTQHSHVVTWQTMTYDTSLRVWRGKVVGAMGAAGGARYLTVAVEAVEHRHLCRGAWARVTMDQFRHLAMQTF